jgi:hypothetical protein
MSDLSKVKEKINQPLTVPDGVVCMLMLLWMAILVAQFFLFGYAFHTPIVVYHNTNITRSCGSNIKLIETRAATNVLGFNVQDNNPTITEMGTTYLTYQSQKYTCDLANYGLQSNDVKIYLWGYSYSRYENFNFFDFIPDWMKLCLLMLYFMSSLKLVFIFRDLYVKYCMNISVAPSLLHNADSNTLDNKNNITTQSSQTSAVGSIKDEVDGQKLSCAVDVASGSVAFSQQSDKRLNAASDAAAAVG